mgnify:CR=1 FL=1
MRSLFAKIFLWFWVAMTLVSVASLLFALHTKSYPLVGIGLFKFVNRALRDGGATPYFHAPPTFRLRVVDGAVGLTSQTAVEVYEMRGPRAFANYVERLERASRIRFFLFDDKGVEVSGRRAPPEVQDLAAHVAGEEDPDYKVYAGASLMARRLSGERGGSFIAVVRMPEHPAIFYGYEPEELAAHILVILSIAGLVCYGLTRYIVAPVRKLQSATRRFADGELEVRVGKTLGNRGDEIGELGRDFDLMAERIESLITAQHRLLRDISHELRSPLTRLGIALELARERMAPDGLYALDRIERESARLNELIQQLLVVARLDSGDGGAGSEARVDLLRLVREVASDALFEAKERGCDVRVDARSPRAETMGSESLLRSAVENVVRNAVRYTEAGTPVEISIESDPEASGGAPDFVIAVRDHGPGIPKEALHDIFRPFYRVDDARDRRRGGVGLGLAIAERAVRRHNGAISAANAKGGGLIVTIRLRAPSPRQAP